MSNVRQKPVVSKNPERTKYQRELDEFGDRFQEWFQKLPQGKQIYIAFKAVKVFGTILYGSDEVAHSIGTHYLLTLGEFICKELEFLKTDPILKHAASYRAVFPVLAGLSVSDRERVQKLLLDLGLGKNRLIKAKKKGRGKRADAGNVINRMAEDLCMFIGDVRKNRSMDAAGGLDLTEVQDVYALKPFEKSTANEWHKVAWKVFWEWRRKKREITIEHDPELWEVGKYRLETNEYRLAYKDGLLSRATIEKLVRSGVKEQLRQAIKRFAPSSPAPSDLQLYPIS